jgi:hypothetical protein
MGFSGTTAECLIDFGTNSSVEARKLLARFAQVTDDPTARDWTAGRQMPQGEPLLRTRCFLHLAGYNPSEFEELPGVTQRFALLMATDLVTLDEVQELLDYRFSPTMTGALGRSLRMFDVPAPSRSAWSPGMKKSILL